MTSTYQEFSELLKSGRYGDAIYLAEASYLNDNPHNPFWLNRQAAALVKAGQAQKAYHIAQKALALQPANPHSLVALAMALMALKRFDDALPLFEEAADKADTEEGRPDENLREYARKGVLECLLSRNQFEQVLSRITQWQMRGAAQQTYQAKAYIGLNRLEDARQAFHERLRLMPDHPNALWELTELEIRIDGLDLVLAKMGRLAKIPSRPPIYKEIYASLLRRAGQSENALKQYEQLAKGEGASRILRKKAFALAKSGREPEALPIMEELLSQNPKDIYMHNAYGAACHRMGQNDRALSFYRDLLVKHPSEKALHGWMKKIIKKGAP